MPVPLPGHAVRLEVDLVGHESAWHQPAMHRVIGVRQVLDVLESGLGVQHLDGCFPNHRRVMPRNRIGQGRHSGHGRARITDFLQREFDGAQAIGAETRGQPLFRENVFRERVGVHERTDFRELVRPVDVFPTLEQLDQFREDGGIRAACRVPNDVEP